MSEKGSLYTLGGKGSSWFEIIGPMWNYDTIKVPICNPRLPPLTPRMNVFWLVVFPKWNNIWDRYILETLSFYIWHDNFSLIICIIQVMKKRSQWWWKLPRYVVLARYASILFNSLQIHFIFLIQNNPIIFCLVIFNCKNQKTQLKLKVG